MAVVAVIMWPRGGADDAGDPGAGIQTPVAQVDPAPPVAPPPVTEQPPVTGSTGATAATGTEVVSGGARGASGSTGGASASGARSGGSQTTTPPPVTTARGGTGRGATGTTGTTGTTGATGSTGQRQGAGVTPPPVTPPTTGNQPPPVATVDSAALLAAAAAAARRAADSAAAATRELLCGSSATAERALNDALAGDIPARLNTLYTPRGDSDTRTKNSVIGDMRGARNIRVNAGALRAEPSGDLCEWVVRVGLNWQDGFGRPGRRDLEMRMQLEATAGNQVRVRALHSATTR